MDDEQEVTSHESEPELTEREVLEREKISLAQKIGIMGQYNPVPNFRGTDEFKRIEEINKRLWVLVKN